MKGWRQGWFLAPGVSIFEALCEWYYKTEDESTGDVAVHTFENNVVVCEIPMGAEKIEIPLRSHNPYTSSFFLFYTWRPLSREVSVWGGITWRALYRLHGCVNLNKDTQQNRAFLPVFDLDDASQKKDDENRMFYLPLYIPRGDEFVFPDASIEDIKGRFEWVIGSNTKYVPCTFAVTYAPSALALGLFECTITSADKRVLFHTMRVEKEQQELKKALQNFDEMDFMRLFVYNGLKTYMAEAMVQEVETDDLYWFWIRMTRGGQSEHPKDCSPPKYIFRVPMEECPIVNLPLHEYGLVHLTYKELEAWILQLFVTQFQQMAFQKPIPREEEERWIKPLRDILEKTDLNQRKTIPVPIAPSFLLQNQFPSTSTVTDIEDIIKVAPPCVANCMSAQRFVYNNEALRLIPILQETGVSKDIVSAWLEQQNAKFPHPTVRYKDANARRGWITMWDKPKGYKQRCDYIIKDTLSKNPNALTCPFANAEDPQAQCASDQKFPWKAPSTVISRRLRAKK